MRLVVALWLVVVTLAQDHLSAIAPGDLELAVATASSKPMIAQLLGERNGDLSQKPDIFEQLGEEVGGKQVRDPPNAPKTKKAAEEKAKAAAKRAAKEEAASAAKAKAAAAQAKAAKKNAASAAKKAKAAAKRAAKEKAPEHGLGPEHENCQDCAFAL